MTHHLTLMLLFIIFSQSGAHFQLNCLIYDPMRSYFGQMRMSIMCLRYFHRLYGFWIAISGPAQKKFYNFLISCQCLRLPTICPVFLNAHYPSSPSIIFFSWDFFLVDFVVLWSIFDSRCCPIRYISLEIVPIAISLRLPTSGKNYGISLPIMAPRHRIQHHVYEYINTWICI